MKNNKMGFGMILMVFLISLSVFILIFTNKDDKTPKVVYTVYLDGKSIGTLASKDSFDSFINKKEEELKSKYNVDTIYTPKGVEIKKNITYSNSVDSEESIYNKIIEKRNFTIRGYQITIMSNDEEENKSTTIYTLNKDIFDKAIVDTIKSFVDEEDYEKFLNGTQEEIKDSGSLIENIDILENIVYKEAFIDTDEKIFVDEKELSSYLLYGTSDYQEKYTVKSGDTIESIANDHKLNVKEFLIANPDFTSENNLLYEEQEVNVGLINPLISVAVDVHSVGDEERAFDTEFQYDSSQYIGYQETIKEGENGLYKVTRKSQYINGQLSSGVITNSTEIKPPINRIVLKGKKYAPEVADLTYWAWPTEKPYTITSYYQYRWGSFHDAIDIYVGNGSAIYAANNGVVAEVGGGCTPGNSKCYSGRGNYILVNHNAGGYYTLYQHLNSIYVSVGQTVARGQKIASMGNTGFVVPAPSSRNPYSGTHLHFSVYVGGPFRNSINPLRLY